MRTTLPKRLTTDAENPISVSETIAKADVFSGGGEMGARMRAKDWAATKLGPVQGWSNSLKTAVSICLNSRFPMVIWWGSDLVLLYNDGWRPILGENKDRIALGSPGREVWCEIWDVLEPMFFQVLNEGKATWTDDGLLLVNRYGFIEEAYFTWSYSPIRDDDGKVGGVFTAVTETTARVIGERRLKTLRDLGERTLEHASSPEKACRAAAEILARNDLDFPFALIYLLDNDGRQVRLTEQVRMDRDKVSAPKLIQLGHESDPWNLSAVLAEKKLQLLDTADQFGRLPAGAWKDDFVRQAAVIPLAKAGVQDLPAGFLVCGLSPRIRFDENYRSFLELASGHVATAITNARALEEERKRAEALAELDRAKTTFFSNISHEFRTPLTLMLGPTEDALSSPERSLRDAELETVHRNELRLLKLVNTLLDFSRIEAGRVKAAYEPVNLAAYTSELASVFRSAIERAGLVFRVETPKLSQSVYVDREMWEKIVLNLLSNALKSTFQGTISVRLRELEDHVEIAVRDTGTGIPEKDLPHLFERFRRIEGAKRRTHEGSGIGLALVHELVRMHGGSIAVQSKIGKGTTFTVSIPLGTSHLAQEQVITPTASAIPGAARTAFQQEALSWLEPNASSGSLDEMPAPLDFAETSGATVGGNTRARVLVVDDNRDMREYLQRLLSARFEVMTAENGKTGVEICLRHIPDLVLSDVMMPEMDGFQLLAALRQNPATSSVPVILLSARAGEESRVEGMEAGADDYLVKPFTARELVARVDTHIRIARFRREAIEKEARLQHELDEARRLTADAIENISDAFFLLDCNWRFTYANSAGKRMVAAAGGADTILGTTLWQTFPDLLGTEVETHYRRCMSQRVPVEFQTLYAGRSYHVRAYPEPAGGIAIYSADVTARNRTELALRMKQEHLRLTQEAAQIGQWELDVQEEELAISPEFAKICGLPAYVLRLRYSDFLNALFVSSDRKEAETVIDKAVKGNKEFSIQLRLKRPDGCVRLVSSRGKAFYNQGKPIILGVLLDITPENLETATKINARTSRGHRVSRRKRAS